MKNNNYVIITLLRPKPSKLDPLSTQIREHTGLWPFVGELEGQRPFLEAEDRTIHNPKSCK